MSARATGLVIEHYPHGGNELLLAIVLADEADHHGGNIRAAIPILARLSRQTEQNTRRLLRKMQADGWLQCVEPGGGRGKVALYRISEDWMRLPLGFVFGAKPELNVPLSEAAKPEQKGNLMFGFKAPLSEPTPFLSSITPPLPPQLLDGSAVPSAIDAGEEKDLDLARWMLGLIRKLHPKHREPNWSRWQRDIRVMVKAGHSLRDIAELFKWANADAFWQTNILSPAKLWTQWDTLQVKRTADPNRKPAAAPIDPLCSHCRKRPWSMQHGKTGARVCGPCYDNVTVAA